MFCEFVIYRFSFGLVWHGFLTLPHFRAIWLNPFQMNWSNREDRLINKHWLHDILFCRHNFQSSHFFWIGNVRSHSKITWIKNSFNGSTCKVVFNIIKSLLPSAYIKLSIWWTHKLVIDVSIKNWVCKKKIVFNLIEIHNSCSLTETASCTETAT